MKLALFTGLIIAAVLCAIGLLVVGLVAAVVYFIRKDR